MLLMPTVSTLFPYTTLFRSYNDYNGEALGAKSDAIYELLRGLKARAVPIHGVGLQSHFSLDRPPPMRDVAANMKRLARSEEHTSELQSLRQLVCRLLLEKKQADRSSRRSRARGRNAGRRRAESASWQSTGLRLAGA